MELKLRTGDRADKLSISPNCTLVELKLHRLIALMTAAISKLYLSGIEIKIGNMTKVLVKHSKLYLSGIEIIEC